MIYQLLRFPLVILFFFFYKRIYVTGRAALPSKAPTIVATNHSTAFIEQILIAGLQTRSVFFWARGSVFEEKWSLPKVFRQAHLIPIWRPQEGLKKMQQNQQIFKDSKDILLEGNLFFIAPEGNSVPEKRLRTFKTGTARLALLAAAESNFETPIFISPTGVNYTYHSDFRSEVIINFGPAIDLKKYKTIYNENPSAAAKKLTKDLKAAITKEVVVIESKEDEALVEQLHVLMRNEQQHYKDATYSTNPHRLRLEQDAANTCNQITPVQKEALKAQADSYFKKLQTHHLTDQAVEQQGAFAFGKACSALLLAPFALLGWVGSFIPVRSARYLRNKNVEDPQFWAAMALVFSLLTWFLYSIPVVALGAYFLGWKAFLLPLILVMLQYIAYVQKEQLQDVLQNRTYRQLQKKQIHLIQLLQKERKDLVTKYLFLAK
ncbi:MAG: Phospholipid/glycerol acyltransferase [uncultured Aureispira sp.]|uniref:Phospholipid/glycerol acyltransferase n=1 Tax=uncultured Aureispira sp. TaxID=1331704 RepID=A0A6S6U527_9BACT|nr:MAG: Phospholipid/glycerol acyltransferase [uncultured Aureispira sp.]